MTAGRVDGVGEGLDAEGAEERLVHVVRVVVEVVLARLVPLPAHVAHHDVASDALDPEATVLCRRSLRRRTRPSHDFGHFSTLRTYCEQLPRDVILYM